MSAEVYQRAIRKRIESRAKELRRGIKDLTLGRMVGEINKTRREMHRISRSRFR